MIKIIKEGQKIFTRTCDRCGCKFQYDLRDLNGLDYLSCPYCHTTLTHIGPHTKKVGPNDIDLSKINFTPHKVKVDDVDYNYGTTTSQYTNPNTTININKPGSDSVIGKVDPNVTIYANNLPDDIVDDPYNNIGMQLPDDIKDNCCYVSDGYKAWYEKWCKEIQDNKSIKCKK